jgi:hypothetical protein
MTKALGWTAAIGLVLCVLFLGLAAARVGSALDLLGFDDGFDAGFAGDKPSAAAGGMKQWVWKGDSVEIAAPAEVRVSAPASAAEPPTITVHGSPRILDRVRFSNGKLGLVGRLTNMGHSDHLEVDIRGVFHQYTMMVGELRLGTIDQDRLAIRISGAGEVRADGKVGDLDVAISGVGGAKLGRLIATNAHVKISGAGDAEIAPQDSADISLSGIGEVKLRSQPKKLVQHVSGLGQVKGPGSHDDDDADKD